MSTITSRQALQYLERWKLVREREAREMPNGSMELRARQLSVLMASRALFADDPQREHRVEELRQRWMLIYRARDA